MRTPLASVRVTHSESTALLAGFQFDTLEQFEAALRGAHSSAAAGRIAFVITWKDRHTFHGVCDLERRETVLDHVARVGRMALADERLSCLLDGIRLTIIRLFQTAVAERHADIGAHWTAPSP